MLRFVAVPEILTQERKRGNPAHLTKPCSLKETLLASRQKWSQAERWHEYLLDLLLMPDLSDDGCLVTNAIYQQLELRVTV
jgi:hypothetical protein